MSEIKRTAYVVRVNEAAVFATGKGVDWWMAFRQCFDATGRITDVVVSIGGNMCHVACASKDDAAWLADQMVNEHRLVKSAVRVALVAS